MNPRERRPSASFSSGSPNRRPRSARPGSRWPARSSPRTSRGRFAASGVFAAAALLVVFGLQFLVVAAVLALATQLGAWLASLLVSVLCLIAGAIALLIARSRSVGPFLKRTREAPGEDLRWLSTLVR